MSTSSGAKSVPRYVRRLIEVPLALVVGLVLLAMGCLNDQLSLRRNVAGCK